MTIVDDLNDGVKFSEVIKIDEGKVRQRSTRSCGRRWRRHSTGCWMPRPTSCAVRNAYERSVERVTLPASIRRAMLALLDWKQ